MLSLGLVGPANVGKSTLFNALTKQSVLMADYPFATIKPNQGLIYLPDDRLRQLAGLFEASVVKPAIVNFVDIAGLVAGASQGQGLGNTFLAQIRTSPALVLVLAAFGSEADPVGRVKTQLEMVSLELRLADSQTLDRIYQKNRRQAATSPQLKARLDSVQAAQAALDDGLLIEAPESDRFRTDLAEFGLLTLKPIIYLFNLAEADLTNRSLAAQLTGLLPPSAVSLALSAKFELELSQLPAADQAGFLADYGLRQSGVDRLARLGFDCLGLTTFLTAGPAEVRAWTIKAGQIAREAAGVIHDDIRRGFIKAEVVDYRELLKAGSWSEAFRAGLVRQEGRDYRLGDNDVVNFRFNV